MSSGGEFHPSTLDYENPSRTVEIQRRRSCVVLPNGTTLADTDETFQQAAPSMAATPVSRLFLVLVLTGCRLGEASRCAGMMLTSRVGG